MATAALPVILSLANEADPTRVRLDSGAILDLEPVTSSRLTAVGYDEETSLLVMQFPTGAVYAYEGVEQDVYEQLVTAESIGKFANEHIIGKRGSPAKYRYHKLVMDSEGTHQRVQSAILEENPGLRITEVPPTRVAISGPGIEGEIVRELPPLVSLPTDDQELPRYAVAAKTAAAALVVFQPSTGLIVSSPEHYRMAEEKLVQLANQRKQIEERVLRVYDPAYKAYIEARSLRDEALKPFDEATSMLKAGMLAFCRKEEADRRAAEVEQRRILEAKSLEDAREQGKQEAEREASYLEAQGEHQEAAVVRANPVPIAPAHVPAVVLPSSVPTGGKASRKSKWAHRIKDEREIPVTFAPAIESLLRENRIEVSGETATKIARALGPIFAEFYVLDPKAIGERARRLKSHANIAGVEVYDEGAIAVRTK